jgi:hypothetical protein
VELSEETPKQLVAARYCESYPNVVNKILPVALFATMERQKEQEILRIESSRA